MWFVHLGVDIPVDQQKDQLDAEPVYLSTYLLSSRSGMTTHRTKEDKSLFHPSMGAFPLPSLSKEISPNVYLKESFSFLESYLRPNF